MSRNKASLLYDADAPYIVESSAGVNDVPEDANDAPPSYTYSDGKATRSWDDASREKTRAIDPQADASRSAYVDVESQSGFAPPPAPLNSTITGYATSYGFDLGILCAFPYVLPPFTSIPVLLWETQNVRLTCADQDLARFHAYQMAACGVAATISLWIFRLVFHWATFAWCLSLVFYLAVWYGGCVCVY